MKTIKFILVGFGIMLFPILTYANTISSVELDKQTKEGNTLSDGFNSLQECSTTKDRYNLEFASYKRSGCFSHNNKYHYFICQLSNSCSVNLSSSSTSTQNISNKDKLDVFLLKVKNMRTDLNDDVRFENILNQISSNLKILSNKYKTNNTISQMITYINAGIQDIRNDLVKNSEVDTFLCELLGNCGTDTVHIESSNKAVNEKINSGVTTQNVPNEKNTTINSNTKKTTGVSIDTVCNENVGLVAYACWKPYQLNLKAEDRVEANETYFIKEDEVVTINWGAQERLNKNPITYKIYIDNKIVYEGPNTSWTGKPRDLGLVSGGGSTPLYLQDEKGLVYNLNGGNIKEKQYIVRMEACQYDDNYREMACTKMAPDDRTRDSFMLHVGPRPAPTVGQEKIFDIYVQNNNYEKAAQYALGLGFSPEDIAQYVNQKYNVNLTKDDIKKYAGIPVSNTTEPTQGQLNTFDTYVKNSNYEKAAQYALGLGYSPEDIAQYVNQTYGANISPQDVKNYANQNTGASQSNQSTTVATPEPTASQINNFDGHIQSGNFSEAAAYALQQGYSAEQIAEYVNKNYGASVSPQDVQNYANQR